MRFELSNSVRKNLGLAAGALVLTFASASSMAAIVCNSAAIPVPQNIDGVYINLATNATGTSGGGVTGWDINLYQTTPTGGTPGLYFFWPTTPANSYGGVSTDTIYDVLNTGAPIGPGQTYILNAGGGGAAAYANWHGTTQTGRYLGVRFFNEATSAINFGWLQLNTTATSGFPATINQICYDNTGIEISAGTTPVSLQQFSVD